MVHVAVLYILLGVHRLHRVNVNDCGRWGEVHLVLTEIKVLKVKSQITTHVIVFLKFKSGFRLLYLYEWVFVSFNSTCEWTFTLEKASEEKEFRRSLSHINSARFRDLTITPVLKTQPFVLPKIQTQKRLKERYLLR